MLTPRLFLSYSRQDAALAKSLAQSLRDRGYRVFVDVTEVLAGDDFVDRIVTELRRSDAVVALVTPAAATSPWCQAELYHAHALGVPVVPVHSSGGVELAPPLELMQRRTHRLETETGEQLPATVDRHLREAHRRRFRRLFLRFATILLAVGVVAGGAFGVVSNLDAWETERRRDEVVARIERLSAPMGPQVLASEAERWLGDDELLARLSEITEDSGRTDLPRFNAWLLATALRDLRLGVRRWVLQDLDWGPAQVSGGRLIDVTFASGGLHDVTFERNTFAGVVWNGAPTPDEPGLVLSKVRFAHSDFYFTWFAGTSTVRLEVVNSSFRGSDIDITNFGLARFVSEVSEPQYKNLITDEVTIIENSTITNRGEPPAPGVLDLASPEDQVRFDNVVFVGVRFRGWIRPEWFRDCSFQECTLPVSTTAEALQAGGNLLYDCIWQDLPLD